MVDYQTLSIVLTGIGMIIALTYYGLQIRNQNKARQAQLFMQVYDKLSNEMLVPHHKLRYDWKLTNVDDFFNNFIDPEKYPDNLMDWNRVLYYWESLGVLAQKGYIDVNLVENLMSGMTLFVWDKMEPFVMEYRERFQYPQFQEFHEYLAKEVRRIVDEQHPEFKGLSMYIDKHPELKT